MHALSFVLLGLLGTACTRGSGDDADHDDQGTRRRVEELAKIDSYYRGAGGDTSKP
jgi:hypothetical protein